MAFHRYRLPRGFEVQAERLASDLRAQLGLSATARLDPRGMLEGLGHLVLDLSQLQGAPWAVTHLTRIEPDAFEAATVVGERRALVLVNDSCCAEGQAVALAREAAHLLLRHPPEPWAGGVLEEAHGNQDEAEWLAGCLLIPAGGLRLVLRWCDQDLLMAAEHYGVTLTFMRWRCTVIREHAHAA